MSGSGFGICRFRKGGNDALRVCYSGMTRTRGGGTWHVLHETLDVSGGGFSICRFKNDGNDTLGVYKRGSTCTGGGELARDVCTGR